MRVLTSLLLASVLLLVACGGDDPTPVSAGVDTGAEPSGDGTTAPAVTEGSPIATPTTVASPTTTPPLEPEPEPIAPGPGDDAAPSGEQLESELAAARDRWAAAGIESYTMEQSVVAQLVDLVGPFVVTVTDGTIARVEYAAGALAEGSTPPADAEVATVEEIFELIGRSIGVAAEVRVTYDAETGAPLDVWIDESFQTADEEIGYTVVLDGAG